MRDLERVHEQRSARLHVPSTDRQHAERAEGERDAPTVVDLARDLEGFLEQGGSPLGRAALYVFTRQFEERIGYQAPVAEPAA